MKIHCQAASWPIAVALLFSLATAKLGADGARESEHIHALRLALNALPEGLLTEEKLKARQNTLERLAADLRGGVELREALELDDWVPDDFNTNLARVDQPIRTAILHRLQELLRTDMRSNSLLTQLAALNVIAEFGQHIRAEGKASLGSAMAPELVESLHDKNADVRAAAAHALGLALAEPQTAVAALAGLLGSTAATDRRAATSALADAIRLAAENVATWRYQVSIRSPDVVVTAKAVLDVLAPALNDGDSRVGALAAGVIRQAALAFTTRIENIRLPDRNQVAEERAKAAEELRQVWPGLKSLAVSLRDRLVLLGRLLKSGDDEVVLAADRALETVADARLSSLAIAKNPHSSADVPLGEILLAGLRPALPQLAAQLTNQNVHVRLAALYALESFEAEAAPAAGAVAAVTKDADPFVRWGAARVLAKIAPREAATVVPALTALIDDANADVRGAALVGLCRYGPAASKAVVSLSAALERGDPGTKVLAAKALAAIGLNAKAAVECLLKTMSSPDVEVRAEATRALGAIGERSPRTLEALSTRLHDSEARVRRAATDALFNLGQ
jgi:HEAT repeat protein